MATLKDVAARAGVSRSAVSRCFTEGASVSAKTRAKIEKAADELGYSPNALASSLTTGRTRLIGVVSNNFHNPIFLQVFDLITRRLQERRLRPLLVNLSSETDPTNSLTMLRQYSVDAALVASSTLPVSFAERFHDAGVPVVHLFGRVFEGSEINVVGIDNVAAGRLAAEALLSRGYADIAMLAGPQSATSTQDRLKGFLGAMAEAGAPCRHSFARHYSFEAGRDEMNRLLAEDPAEAYFCGDDVLSIGAMSALRAAGRRVPEDVGLIGLNDMDIAAWDNINLTTIRQPIDQIVSAALDLLEHLLDDPARPPVAQCFPCRVVERGTLRSVAEKGARAS